jgi:hypothetical protein
MKQRKQFGNERGMAMVVVLMALVLLTVVGTLFIAQTKTETQISGHDMRATQALVNAEAGYGEVLARMSDVRDTANYIGQDHGAWTTTPGWGCYVVLATGNSGQDRNRNRTATDGLDNDGDATVDESGEKYPEVPTRQGSDAINYPWAQVRYKLNGANQVLLFGDHDGDVSTPSRVNLLRGYPVLVVTAFGGQGSARRTVEIEAVRPPIEILQSAMYTENADVTFNGTQFLVSGSDWDPVTGAVVPGNPDVPGMITTGNAGTTTGNLNGQQQNNVEGTGGEPSVATSSVDLDLQALRDAYVNMAEVTLPAGTYSGVSWGDVDTYTVVHCTGDMHISGNVTGGGVLIVDGDFTLTGSFTWYGLVLVMGHIETSGGGSGIHLYGAVLSQGANGGDKISGNADIYYSSQALNRLITFSPYVVYNWREL